MTPTTVLTDWLTEVSPEHAAELGIAVEIIFIKRDGTSIGSTISNRILAFERYRDDWVEEWRLTDGVWQRKRRKHYV